MKSCLMFIGLFFISFSSLAQGRLSGSFVINKGEVDAKWGDSIIYVFTLKNSGDKSIDILKVTGSCTCQTPYNSNIQTIKPGKTGTIKVKVALNQKTLSDDVENGVINYDKSVTVLTNGKKQKYELFLRAKIKIKK